MQKKFILIFSAMAIFLPPTWLEGKIGNNFTKTLHCASLAESLERAPREPVPPASSSQSNVLYPLPWDARFGTIIADNINLLNTLTLNGLVVVNSADFSQAAVYIPTAATAPQTALQNGRIVLSDDILYVYDSTRNKWLSASRQTVWSGKAGSVTDDYLASFDGISTKNIGYPMARNATITGITVATGGNSWLVASTPGVGDFTSLQNALASPLVLNGDTITIGPETFTLAPGNPAISISKSVSIIGCDGATIQTAASATDPTTVLSITAGNVFIKNLTVKQRKTTNSSVESAVSITGAGTTGIVLDSMTIETMEFAITINGPNSFTIANCELNYVGPLGNNHRLIAVSKNNGASQIINNIFTPSSDPAPGRTIFCYLDGAGSFAGSLTISGNRQITQPSPLYTRQFYLQDNFTGGAGGFELIITDNSYNDMNGGIIFFDSTGMLNLFSSIIIARNSANNGGGKGLVTIDGFGVAINPGATNWYMADNILANPGVTAPNFADATIIPGLIGYNTTIFVPLSITVNPVIPIPPSPTPLFTVDIRKNGCILSLASLAATTPRSSSTSYDVDIDAGDCLQTYIDGTANNPIVGIEYAYKI